MSTTLMSLGSIMFYKVYPGVDAASFETVSREMVATLPVQGRLGRDDAVQFTGPGEEIISIHGRLFPYMFGGMPTMDALRDALRAGQPLPLTQFTAGFGNTDTSLTSGTPFGGTHVGNYMIRSFKKQNSLYTSDVIPMKVDFTLDLVLYGDDLGGATTPATTDGSSGSSSSATTPATTTPSATTPGSSTGGSTSVSVWSTPVTTPQPSVGGIGGIGSA